MKTQAQAYEMTFGKKAHGNPSEHKGQNCLARFVDGSISLGIFTKLVIDGKDETYFKSGEEHYSLSSIDAWAIVPMSKFVGPATQFNDKIERESK